MRVSSDSCVVDIYDHSVLHTIDRPSIHYISVPNRFTGSVPGVCTYDPVQG